MELSLALEVVFRDAGAYGKWPYHSKIARAGAELSFGRIITCQMLKCLRCSYF